MTEFVPQIVAHHDVRTLYNLFSVYEKVRCQIRLFATYVRGERFLVFLCCFAHKNFLPAGNDNTYRDGHDGELPNMQRAFRHSIQRACSV